MTHLPRAMLIDMDDTILSAYGRPEIAWHNVARNSRPSSGR
jgi:putative hydrolase of the HAD superfamily